jgi:hypothetical protein
VPWFAQLGLDKSTKPGYLRALVLDLLARSLFAIHKQHTLAKPLDSESDFFGLQSSLINRFSLDSPFFYPFPSKAGRKANDDSEQQQNALAQTAQVLSSDARDGGHAVESMMLSTEFGMYVLKARNGPQETKFSSKASLRVQQTCPDSAVTDFFTEQVTFDLISSVFYSAEYLDGNDNNRGDGAAAPIAWLKLPEQFRKPMSSVQIEVVSSQLALT